MAGKQLVGWDSWSASINPAMLDGAGRFKAPSAGVNYMLEGLTPEEAYASAQPQKRFNGDGELVDDYQNAAREQMLDTSWRTGPNNGGGFLGGLGGAVQGIVDGVRTNPAIMAALTAGMAPYAGKGLQAMGMSAGAAKVAAPLVMNGFKTVMNGGSMADAVKSAGMAYIGGQANDQLASVVGKGPADLIVGAATTALGSNNRPRSTGIRRSNMDSLAAQYSPEKLAAMIEEAQRKERSGGFSADDFA